MKTVLVLSVLCVALSVRAAAVPGEDAVKEEDAGVPVQVDTIEAAPEDLPKDGTPENKVPLHVPQEVSGLCPTGWHIFQDSCYLLVNISYSRMNAEFLCESLEANLVSARSIWQYSFLQKLARNAGFSTAWMGGYRFQGFWRWDDGAAFNYNNWYSQTTSSSYECIYLFSQETRGWANDVCTTLRPFICSRKHSYC